MSVASDFRTKWAAIVKAADQSRGDTPDARYTACYQAAEKAGQTLIDRAIVGSLLDDAAALTAERAARERAEQERDALRKQLDAARQAVGLTPVDALSLEAAIALKLESGKHIVAPPTDEDVERVASGIIREDPMVGEMFTKEDVFAIARAAIEAGRRA